VGKGGERIQAFQKEVGAYARVVRRGEAPSGAPLLQNVVDAIARFRTGTAIVLRGRPDAMAKARVAFPAVRAHAARVILCACPFARVRAHEGSAALHALT